MSRKNNIKTMQKEKTFDNSNTTTNSNQIHILKKNFPQCFDKHGDFISDKMREIVSKYGINFSKESYNLNWLGKSYARLLANEQPLTLLKEDTAHNHKTENQNSENLLIKGDNLEVLKHLRRAYSESIDIIYIDPPYNTGNDGFIYADNREFSAEKLQEMAGIDEDEAQRVLDFIDSNSNSHSAWLTFIYPRLYLARELLADDGMIFISIDDNEQAQLKILCDEVFGEGNFINNITVKTSETSGVKMSHTSNRLPKIKEYLLCYTRNKQLLTLNEIKIEKSGANLDNYLKYYTKIITNIKADVAKWKIVPLKEYFAENNLKFSPKEENDFKNKHEDTIVYRTNNAACEGLEGLSRIKNSEGKEYICWDGKEMLFLKDNKREGVCDLWVDISTINLNKEMHGLRPFKNGQKPVGLISRILELKKNKEITILDFFSGSGTTADAVMQLNAKDGGNRKCISVQLDELISPSKNKLAYDFVKNELGKPNPTIFDITKERILRAGEKIQKDNQTSKNPKDLSNQDFGFKIFETAEMFNGFLDEIDKLEDKQQPLPFDGSKLSNDDLRVLLTSWMVADGIKLTQPVEKIILDKYSAYYADKKLYLMDKGFTTNDLKALLIKLDNVDSGNKNFQPNKLVLFGYNFESKHQREINEALSSYTNKKGIELSREVKY